MTDSLPVNERKELPVQKIVPNLWFDTEAEEAANFYLSVFEDSIAALHAAADG